MWIYIETEAGVYTTGFYRGPAFVGDADFSTKEDARERVHLLNGGNGPHMEHVVAQLENIVEKLERLPTNMVLGPGAK